MIHYAHNTLGGSVKAGTDSGSSGKAGGSDEDAALERYKNIMQPLQFVEVEQVLCTFGVEIYTLYCQVLALHAAVRLLYAESYAMSSKADQCVIRSLQYVVITLHPNFFVYYTLLLRSCPTTSTQEQQQEQPSEQLVQGCCG
jgi:hypothetical protein